MFYLQSRLHLLTYVVAAVSRTHVLYERLVMWLMICVTVTMYRDRPPAYRCWSVPGLPRDNLFSLFLYVVWWQWHSDGRRQNLISTTPLYPSRLSSKQVIPTRTLRSMLFLQENSRSMLFLLTPLEVSLPFSFLKNAADPEVPSNACFCCKNHWKQAFPTSPIRCQMPFQAPLLFPGGGKDGRRGEDQEDEEKETLRKHRTAALTSSYS